MCVAWESNPTPTSSKKSQLTIALQDWMCLEMGMPFSYWVFDYSYVPKLKLILYLEDQNVQKMICYESLSQK